MQQRWPDRLWIVRHGESAGNVARDAANAAGSPDDRHRRARRRRAAQPARRGAGARARPLVRRDAGGDAARGRARLALPARAPDRRPHPASAAASSPTPAGPIVDERLREKEFGVLDRLTRVGIEQRYPEQAEFRRLLGKFYHRPPGGESWCDVILRLRSVLDTISLHYGGPPAC